MVFEGKVEDIDDSNQNSLALIGLILVAIAPSISVITGFALKAGLLAIIVFIFTKMWVFGLPAFWYLYIEKGEKSLSLPKNGGWKVSTLLGIGMLIVIFIAYFLLGEKLLKADELIEILDTVGLTVAWKFALAILFWVFINSVLEEYVFRWFITSKNRTISRWCLDSNIPFSRNFYYSSYDCFSVFYRSIRQLTRISRSIYWRCHIFLAVYDISKYLDCMDCTRNR